MSLETDFRALIVGDPTLLGLVSTRVYPSTYPQGATPPALRYMRVAGGPGLHMQGSDGLDAALFQVDVRAVSAASAFAVRDAILSRLHAFRGVQGATDFRLIELASDRGADFEKTDTGSYYTATLDFSVYSRAAA